MMLPLGMSGAQPRWVSRCRWTPSIGVNQARCEATAVMSQEVVQVFEVLRS